MRRTPKKIIIITMTTFTILDMEGVVPPTTQQMGPIPEFNGALTSEELAASVREFSEARRRNGLTKPQSCALGKFLGALARKLNSEQKWKDAEDAYFEAAMSSVRAHGCMSTAHAPALADFAVSLYNSGGASTGNVIEMLLTALHLSRLDDVDQQCGCFGIEDTTEHIDDVIRRFSEELGIARVPVEIKVAGDTVVGETISVLLSVWALEDGPGRTVPGYVMAEMANRFLGKVHIGGIAATGDVTWCPGPAGAQAEFKMISRVAGDLPLVIAGRVIGVIGVH